METETTRDNEGNASIMVRRCSLPAAASPSAAPPELSEESLSEDDGSVAEGSFSESELRLRRRLATALMLSLGVRRFFHPVTGGLSTIASRLTRLNRAHSNSPRLDYRPRVLPQVSSSRFVANLGRVLRNRV